MRKLFTLLIMLSSLVVSAQLRPGAQRFVDAPLTVVTHIDSLTRLDMLDYYHAGMNRPSENLYGGECVIVDEDSLMVTYRYTERFVGQIFALTDGITGVIETLATPILDSSVALYDAQWRPVTGVLPAVGLDSWLTKEGRKHRALVEEQIPFIMYTCEYMPAQQALHYKLSIDKYFTDDDQPQALRYLKPDLFYVWRGGKFKPIDVVL